MNGNSDGHMNSSSLTAAVVAGDVVNGGGKLLIVKKYEDEIAEMKAKYLKHRQILVTNRELAENEVVRIDEIYHDTVNDVLSVLGSVPDIVQANGELSRLQRKLQSALLDEEISLKSSVTSAAGSINKLKMNGNGSGGNGIIAQPTSTEQSL